MGDEEKQEGSENAGDTEGVSEDDGYVWLALIDEVSEITREPWSNVWQKNIYEFFNLVVYSREKRRREEKAIEQWKRKH